LLRVSGELFYRLINLGIRRRFCHCVLVDIDLVSHDRHAIRRPKIDIVRRLQLLLREAMNGYLGEEENRELFL
jgi:hypothetical protein